MDNTGIKQVIVMRSDLQMRKGKMVAQGAHASLKVFLDRKTLSSDQQMLHINMTEDMAAWVYGQFTKICVRVNSEEELLNIYRQAGIKGLPCAIIKDQGHTEFGGVPTYTACAIGPAKAELIDEITGKLQLL
jgi:PTH2 family peptidyl-tRNA hydrolase